MTQATWLPEEPPVPTPTRRPAIRRVRGVLDSMFPEPPQARPRSWRWRLASVVLQVAVVIVAGGLQFLRVPGTPVWDSLYWDDYGTFFLLELEHPWHVFAPMHGYAQLVDHLIGQLATSVPFMWVPLVMAGSGSLIAAACGLVVFHATAGHVRSVTLRVLLGLAVVLSPVAPLEIVASTLGAPWYMLLALFWVMLWRPRTRTGKATAALLAFSAASSTTITVLFAPLLALRLVALRRPREHAVTAGWLAGCLVQLPVVISQYRHGESPLHTSGGIRTSISFYAHDVILPSLGWHLSWWLQSFAGRDGATVIVAVILTVFFAAVLITSPASRVILPTMFVASFVFPVFSTHLEPYSSVSPPVSISYEPGARFTALPVFLIEAAIIVGLDCLLLQRGRHPVPGPAAVRALRVPWTAVAAMGLIAVLAVSCVVDFRYLDTNRATYTTAEWQLVQTRWELDCAFTQTDDDIWVKVMPGIARLEEVPCAGLHFSGRPVPLELVHGELLPVDKTLLGY
jgi:hypothetical protein